MNCQSCQGKSDSYLKGNMPSELRIQVEDHLQTCSECTDVYRLLKLADRVISNEKEVLSNPFLQTRIMAMIDNSTILLNENRSFYRHALKPAIIALTFATSVFAGVLLGNINQPAGKRNNIPYELTLINDATIESVNLLLEE